VKAELRKENKLTTLLQPSKKPEPQAPQKKQKKGPDKTKASLLAQEDLLSSKEKKTKPKPTKESQTSKSRTPLKKERSGTKPAVLKNTVSGVRSDKGKTQCRYAGVYAKRPPYRKKKNGKKSPTREKPPTVLYK